MRYISHRRQLLLPPTHRMSTSCSLHGRRPCCGGAGARDWAQVGPSRRRKGNRYNRLPKSADRHRSGYSVCISVSYFGTLSVSLSPRRPYDCFSIVAVVVVPRSLSMNSMWMDLRSLDTVMRLTPTTFPSRLSVSSIVSVPIRFSETIVWPGSP